MYTVNIPKAFLYQSMLQLIFETKIPLSFTVAVFILYFCSILYDQIWIFFANLMPGWHILTFFNKECTGLLENVRIYNHRGLKSQMILQKQVGHVLRDTLYPSKLFCNAHYIFSSRMWWVTQLCKSVDLTNTTSTPTTIKGKCLHEQYKIMNVYFCF